MSREERLLNLCFLFIDEIESGKIGGWNNTSLYPEDIYKELKDITGIDYEMNSENYN